MIPVQPFIKPEPKSREFNAIAKALKAQPSVKHYDVIDGFDTYLVKDTYTVKIFMDAGGQAFIECDCPAGTAEVDDATGLPTREGRPCYHAAQVLLTIAENDKESNDVSTRS